MSTDENPIESDWNVTLLKKEDGTNEDKKKPNVRPKENRNFCERWLNIFSPWLSRCEDDSNRPFCRACQRPLDNNRFRLQRHERTAKHSRNQEILLNEGEDAVRAILSRNKQRKRYIKKEFPINYAVNIERTNSDGETSFRKLKIPKGVSNLNNKFQANTFVYPKQECDDMREYYYSPPRYSRPPPAPLRPKKDSFDLFFEAICATVKNLPPKLAAEVKGRISQVIAGFELRAICEKEAKEKAQQSIIELPTQVGSVVTIDPVITTETNDSNTSAENQQTIECGSTVTRYVYSYQQKNEIN